jgi:OmpA-OmpF porin, OOP family
MFSAPCPDVSNDSEGKTMLNKWQLAAVCLGLITGPGSAGYLVDSSGDVVRNNYGECFHGGFWTPDQAIVGCDGKLAEVAVVQSEFAAVEPAAPTVEQIVLDADTNFAFDEAEVRPLARTKLDAVLAALEGFDDLLAIRIEGHADRIGDKDYNRDLAMERAEAVARYLIAEGRLDPELVTVISMGESDPLVPCADERGDALIDCLAPNRRVDLQIEATKIR